MGNATKETQIYSLILILLVFTSMLNNIPLIKLELVGLLSIVLVFIFSFYALLIHFNRKKISKYLFLLLLLGILYLIINSFGFFLQSNFIIVTIQFIILYTFFIFTILTKWDSTKLYFLSKLAGLLILINFVLLVGSGFPIHYSGLFNNPNSLGMFVFLLYFFYLVNVKRSNKLFYLIPTLIVLITVYYSSSRSIILALVIVWLTYIFWGFIMKNKFRFLFYILVVIIAIMSFIFIYPKIETWKNFSKLNTIMWEYTGKNLLSGRETIWKEILDAITEKIWFGHGAGTVPSTIQGIQLSAHNLYLQIVYQIGLVGLGLFLLIIITIWFGFWNGRYDKKVRLSAAFFVGILVQQSFEVTLTQNNMAMALMQWLIMGVGIGISYRYKSIDMTNDNYLDLERKDTNRS